MYRSNSQLTAVQKTKAVMLLWLMTVMATVFAFIMVWIVTVVEPIVRHIVEHLLRVATAV